MGCTQNLNLKLIHPKRPKPHSEALNPFAASVYGQVLNPPSGAFWVDPVVLAGVNSRYSPQTQGLCKVGAGFFMRFLQVHSFSPGDVARAYALRLRDSSGETP